MPPKSEGVLESSLYVKDVAGSARFYEKIFGFRTISDFGERGCAMQAANRQVLLLFQRVFEKYYATLQEFAWFRETGECQKITMPRT
jgi:catechol 2,3-dioxygenase-like lactoylglutathione lyase family enzyme